MKMLFKTPMIIHFNPVIYTASVGIYAGRDYDKVTIKHVMNAKCVLLIWAISRWYKVPQIYILEMFQAFC